MKCFLITAAALSMTALSMPAHAGDPIAELEGEGVRVYQVLPRPSEMVRHPGPEGWVVYGTSRDPKLTSDDDIPGGKMLQVKIKGATANPWDVGAQAKTQVRMKQGDVLVAAFWARASKLPDGATETRLPLGIQKMSGDYDTYASGEATVTTEWNRYYIYAELPKNFKKGGVGLSAQLGADAHTIDLGPVYLMNMGQGAVDASAMPTASVRRQGAALVPSAAVPNATPTIPAALQSDFASLEGRLPGKPVSSHRPI